MGYLGNTPGDKFLTLEKQVFTTSATDTYTLDREVSSVNDIELFLNNVRQEPTEAYTISGTTLTLASAITSSDSMYCIYQGRAVGTQSPAVGSVTNDMLVGSIANAKLANSSISIDGNSVSLGGSVTGIGGANSPYFYGRMLSSQTLTRGTQTVLTGFTNNELDSDSAFDGQTFTVPSGKDGIYFFHVNIFGDYSAVGNDGELIQLNFKKNGSVSGMPEAKHETTSGQYHLLRVSKSYSIIQNMSAGNTMEITAVLKDGNASGNARVAANASHFMGFKLI